MVEMLNRRSSLKLMVAAGAAIAASRPARAQSGPLVVATLGGSFETAQREAIFEPFQKQTGIETTVLAYSSPSQVVAQQKSGNIEWDTILLSTSQMLALAKEGYLQKIDYDAIDKKALDGIKDKSLIHPYGVPNIFFTRGMAYNTKLLGAGPYPTTWQDVWDVGKFSGSRSLAGFVGSLTPDLEFALLADGVAIDALYPLDVDRAFANLDKIRANVAKFWTSGALPAQLLVDGEVSIASCYANRIGDIATQNTNLVFEWNQGCLQGDYWCILEGAHNYDAAMKMISYATEAEIQAKLSNLNLLGPANTDAYELISPERAKLLPTSPENIKGQFFYDDQWWAENFDQVQKRWESWSLR